MFKELLKNVDELIWLRDISLIFFFLLFVAIIVWVIFLDKKYVNHMRNLPLEKEINIDNK